MAWELSGNLGTNPPTDFLGTKDNKPLVIGTNNAQRLCVHTSGDVGIGTPTPAAVGDIPHTRACHEGSGSREAVGAVAGKAASPARKGGRG